jgi:hypothetical protein
MGTEGFHHNDHCWLVVGGRAWAIRRIRQGGTIFDLWRGSGRLIEFALLDASDVDWHAYCRVAACLLERRKWT